MIPPDFSSFIQARLIFGMRSSNAVRMRAPGARLQVVLCGVLPPQRGSPVCTGDTISFCNNVYIPSQAGPAPPFPTMWAPSLTSAVRTHALVRADHRLRLHMPTERRSIHELFWRGCASTDIRSLICTPSVGTAPSPAATSPAAPASPSVWHPPQRGELRLQFDCIGGCLIGDAFMCSAPWTPCAASPCRSRCSRC